MKPLKECKKLDTRARRTIVRFLTDKIEPTKTLAVSETPYAKTLRFFGNIVLVLIE